MGYLYPEIQPYNSGLFVVDAVHRIYFEECGNPDGKPVLFIHGGPGGAVNPMCRRFFNPNMYRIILVDQRGCGNSLPHTCIENNTTQLLIQDFEKLRVHLGIAKWQLFGGSWGSTLALVYAEEHPEVISEMILRGIFLGNQEDTDWIFQHGASKIFPAEWEDFIAPIPEHKRDNLMAAYYEILQSDNEELKARAAVAWSRWEFSISKLHQDPKLIAATTEEKYSLAIATLECHYLINKCFLTENQILDNIERIKHIPLTIVHGRYDIVCLPKDAWILHKAMPGSVLNIIPDAGHSHTEPGIMQGMVAASDAYARSWSLDKNKKV